MKRDHENLKREVLTHSNQMSVAGIALVTIGDLLGASTEDHNLSPKHLDGLAYAVQALGHLIQDSANHLYFFAEDGEVK